MNIQSTDKLVLDLKRSPKMKKVGIITLHGYLNYGNKFQNYATQEVLKSLGCEPITIANDVSIKQNRKAKFIKKIKRLNLEKLIKFACKIPIKLQQRIYLTSNEKMKISLRNERIENFKEFTKSNINETNYIINEANIPEDFHEQFDYFVVGSDQVWNPHYINNSSIYFLSFAPQEKRIAYSASFGISELPDEFVESYKDRLYQFEHISVREEAGADIVSDLTGRYAEVLIDPSLMLDKKEWLEVARNPQKKPCKPYILTYFLGQVSNEVKELINILSKEYNLEIVILEEGNLDVKDEVRYTTDPGEFIDYVNSAELILTDSFHGTVFSILFEKPFITFDRKSKEASMTSRIDTLLGIFELEDRKWRKVKKTQNIFDVSFSHVPLILENERTKAINYLKNALDIKED